MKVPLLNGDMTSQCYYDTILLPNSVLWKNSWSTWRAQTFFADTDHYPHRPVARLLCVCVWGGGGGANLSNFGTFDDYAWIILQSRWIWPFFFGGGRWPPLTPLGYGPATYWTLYIQLPGLADKKPGLKNLCFVDLKSRTARFLVSCNWQWM